MFPLLYVSPCAFKDVDDDLFKDFCLLPEHAWLDLFSVRMNTIPTRVRHVDNELPKIGVWPRILIAFSLVSSEFRMKLLVDVSLSILSTRWTWTLPDSRVWVAAMEYYNADGRGIVQQIKRSLRTEYGEEEMLMNSITIYGESRLSRGLVAPVLWTNYMFTSISLLTEPDRSSALLTVEHRLSIHSPSRWRYSRFLVTSKPRGNARANVPPSRTWAARISTY